MKTAWKFLWLLVPCSLHAQTAPDLHAFVPSYEVPYANPADVKTLDAPLRVKARINGGPVSEFTVDTGSVGMIVSVDEVPNIDPNAPEGKITYSSSGVELHGVWTVATVVFPDAHGAGGVATAVVPVLAVSSEVCTGAGVNAAKCHPSEHPHPHMLGVGFGRGPEGHPEKNPFLNLKEMQAGTMRRGYILNHAGIALGLTAQGAGEGFVWQKLKERPVSPQTAAFSGSLKDWETAPGSFHLDGAKVQAGAGTVLMDTGLTNMMLAADSGAEHGDIPDGQPVTIDLLDGKLHYTFRVGDAANPQTPRRVSWVKPTHGTYVNTGLRALAGFDYLFDADGGWLALRPLSH